MRHAVFFSGLVFVTAAGPSSAQPIAEWDSHLKNLNRDYFRDRTDEFRKLVTQDQRLRLQAHAAFEYRMVWTQFKTLESWQLYRSRMLSDLRKGIGLTDVAIAEPLRGMKIKVARELPGEGFVIQNLLYETRPDWWVSANLYLPKPLPAEQPPAVIISHSHHNAKTQGELQDMGMTWARAGVMVLVPDHPGHGERRSHEFHTEKDYPKPFRVGRQDYYFRANIGLQLDLIGQTLLGWQVWDLARGIDVLLKRGADPKRIVMLGAVAGGGDPAGVAAALDERIAVVAPFNFGGTQPDYRTPPEPDKDFYWFGSVYWETTRSLRNFVPHWAVVASVAPRRLIHAHEFDWDPKQDPAFPLIENIFKLHDKPDHLAVTKGQGTLQGQAPESSHCNNIGVLHRSRLYPHVEKWLGMPIPKEYSQRLPADDLRCWTPELKAELKPLALHEVLARIADEQTKVARSRFDSVPEPHRASVVLKQWYKALDATRSEADWRVTGTSRKRLGSEGISIQLILERDQPSKAGTRSLPLTFIGSDAKNPRSPIVLILAPGGLQGVLNRRHGELVDLLAAGHTVCIPELYGWGELADLQDSRRHSASSTGRAQTERALGSSILAQQLADLSGVLTLFKDENKLDRPMVIWADALTEPNPAQSNFKVPLEVDPFPRFAEPGPGILALLLALSEPHRVKAIAITGLLASYRDILRSPYMYVPSDAMPRNLFGTGDIAELVAALAPLPLYLATPVDAWNREIPPAELENQFSRPIAVYQQQKAQSRLKVVKDRSNTTKWLLEQLGP